MTTKPLSANACALIESLIIDGRAAKACQSWEERALGNQYIRKMRFEFAGDYMRGHTHHFDHNTIIFTGAVQVFAIKPSGEKINRIYRSPRPGKFPDRQEGYVCIQADTFHEFIALEDCTEAWCCFSHRGEHGEVVNKYQGNQAAYGSTG